MDGSRGTSVTPVSMRPDEGKPKRAESTISKPERNPNNDFLPTDQFRECRAEEGGGKTG